MSKLSIMCIAGDPSGDTHTAPILRRINAIHKSVDLWGIGGPEMEAQGFSPVMPFAPFNKMGFVEVAAHIGFFLGAKSRLIRMMASRRPDVLLCVDYSGFNIPMMKAAHRLGIPVVWYIAPMVWAWKKKRAAVLGRYASHIAVIFPFEAAWFEGYRAKVSFVGNPLMESLASRKRCDPESFHSSHREIRLALIPGSREQEIRNLLPAMIETARSLLNREPRLRVTVSRCSYLKEELFTDVERAGFDLYQGPLRELLENSDVAVITSGTASLEAALVGIPHCVVYKTSPLTYRIFRYFVKIPYIALPNIIASERIIPECIQDEMTPEIIGGYLEKFMRDKEYYAMIRTKLSAIQDTLGSKKPSLNVADILNEYLG